MKLTQPGNALAQFTLVPFLPAAGSIPVSLESANGHRTVVLANLSGSQKVGMRVGCGEECGVKPRVAAAPVAGALVAEEKTAVSLKYRYGGQAPGGPYGAMVPRTWLDAWKREERAMISD